MRSTRRTLPLPRREAPANTLRPRVKPAREAPTPAPERPAAKVPVLAIVREPALRRAAFLEARANVAAAANESDTLPAALRTALAALAAALGWPVGRACLVNSRGGVVGAPVWHAGPGFDAFRHALASAPIAGDAPAAQALAAGAPVWVEDLASFAPAGEAGLRSAVAFTVPAAGGTAAVVELFSEDAQAADPAVLEACAWTARQLCSLAERLGEREALRGAADLLRGTLDGAGAAVASFDAGGELALWTATAERLLGWSAEGAAARLDDPTAEPCWVGLRKLAARAVRTGEAASAALRWARPDGALEVEVACEPIRDARGVVRGAVARFAGVAADEAVPAPEREVLAMVAHDLRSPLNVITVATGALLRASAEDPERVAEQVQLALVAQAADRMRRMVGDLLEAERLEAGRVSVAPGTVPVGVLLQGALEQHRPLAEEKGITLRVLSFPSCAVMADEQRVHQVFSNLVGNALAHTPRGGMVLLAARQEGREVRLSVADTGAGIQPEHLPRIFDRFWRGRRAPAGGAGLGLSIARSLVEAHGGRIWAESTPGEGATLTFSLPVA